MLDAVVLEMAKKKTKPEKPERKSMVIQVRGSQEYNEWVEEFAKFQRLPISGLVDLALVMWAKESGFKPPPPR